ncbi:MAG: cyanophycinase [Planctomycetes bacterium]|nr:cyanophycinase [Planctomycetota bacterium]
MIDLTQWRREAIDRTIEPFPPSKPNEPFVENGTLIIVGGGGMPKGLMDRFVELAGGVDKARLVYVPCSERDTLSDQQRTVQAWQRMGVKHATFIHTKDRIKANSDQEFLAPLKDATGIWFGGGRQWNFADSYYGTKAHELMKDVVRRGGVVGGSSAGASIQARYLARATPIENFDIMAPGYERGGLGFISGVAIDQHFSQRGRQKDMTQLVNRYPQILGIGLDEATAIIVRGSKADVVGRGKVHFYDRNLPVFPDRPDYIALPAGSQYDLAARKTIKDTSEKKKPSAPAAEKE